MDGYTIALMAALAWMAGGLWLAIVWRMHPKVYVGGVLEGVA